MARNRRKKRNAKRNTKFLHFKTFLTVILVLIMMILICVSSIFYRNDQNKKTLAKQRMKLEQSIEEIFTETTQNIENSKEEKRDTTIRISAVGDILCGEEMLKDAYQEQSKSYYFDNMFQNITSFITRSDIVLGTMETNFTDQPYSGYGNRNSPKEFGQAIKNSGINLVSITTNHSLDYGINGLQETKKYLQELGFSTVGDKLGTETVNIQNKKGVKIAFLSYTYGVENQNEKTKQELDSINIFEEKQAKKELAYAEENADCTVVIMHWGDSYATEPSKEQEKLADFLVENGADIILGNHPAVIQPMEVRKNAQGENVFIAYSLGNYISSIYNETSKVELVLNIELRKSAQDKKVVLSKVDYTPIYVLDHGSEAVNRYELIDMKGVAKEYAGGNTKIVEKQTYEKLLDGLTLLEKVVKIEK